MDGWGMGMGSKDGACQAELCSWQGNHDFADSPVRPKIKYSLISPFKSFGPTISFAASVSTNLKADCYMSLVFSQPPKGIKQWTRYLGGWSVCFRPTTIAEANGPATWLTARNTRGRILRTGSHPTHTPGVRGCLR